jgi:hypothetical protein
MTRDFYLDPPATAHVTIFDRGRDVNGNGTAHFMICWDNGLTGADRESGRYNTNRRQQTGYSDTLSDGALIALNDMFKGTAWKVDPESVDGDHHSDTVNLTMTRDYDSERTPVLFRVAKSGDYKNVVDAFFPTHTGTNDPWVCGVYAHSGQHGTTSKHYYETTRPATPDEIEPLRKELESIGYKLEICKRWTQRFDDVRFATLNRKVGEV